MIPGGMMGVRSKSKDESIRLYLGRNHYNEWQFIYVGQQQMPGGAGRGQPGGSGGPGGRGVVRLGAEAPPGSPAEDRRRRAGRRRRSSGIPRRHWARNWCNKPGRGGAPMPPPGSPGRGGRRSSSAPA